MDVSYCGWLTKSPPENKMKGFYGPFKSQWRRRYFVLFGPPKNAAASQFVSGSHACLHYYDNEDQGKKKGEINLKDCLEVRDRLDSNYYKHLFSLHTNTRTYYLAAESEIEMNSWVEHLIQSLGLNVGGSDTVSPLPVIPMLPTNGLPGQISANKASNVGGSMSFSPGDNKTKPIVTTKPPCARKFSEPGIPMSRALENTAMMHVLAAVVECPVSTEYPDDMDKSAKKSHEMHHGRKSTDSHYQSPLSVELLEDSEDESSGVNSVPISAPRHLNRCDSEREDLYDSPMPGGHNSNNKNGSDDDIYDRPPPSGDGSDDIYDRPPPSGDGSDDIYDRPPPSGDGSDDIYDVPPSGGQQSSSDEDDVNDIYDLPPPTAHDRRGARVHSYINAASGVVNSTQADEISVALEGATTSLADSVISDENDDYDRPPNIRISLSANTRSFRKSHGYNSVKSNQGGSSK